jgi:hypothetical protein
VTINGVKDLPKPLETQIGVDIPVYPVSSDPTKFGFKFVVGTLGLGGSSPIYIDPLVAIGYDFQILSGPLFTSVVLPHIGDDLFALYLWDLLANDWIFDGNLRQGFRTVSVPMGSIASVFSGSRRPPFSIPEIRRHL